MPPAPEPLLEQIATCWDVVVVGAGPAGALAAHGLASRGVRVLLVEQRHFPRWKVCGACLSPQALAVLEAAGCPAHAWIWRCCKRLKLLVPRC